MQPYLETFVEPNAWTLALPSDLEAQCAASSASRIVVVLLLLLLLTLWRRYMKAQVVARMIVGLWVTCVISLVAFAALFNSHGATEPVLRGVSVAYTMVATAMHAR